ncbi:hypothetical protein K469DRAFT_692273 [Zopfia rhizophila CBS 207.26]|uniref:Uncharacterized protein n=1 Tax=Zopfia rhizophila CBS 207.26 TaxID=1314779 RepID=A0A6A6DNA2_9PEZI|nr:hypothetical protein K469DRAFT_692273 [Zopfia rhizophila CBS 207.26]
MASHRSECILALIAEHGFRGTYRELQNKSTSKSKLETSKISSYVWVRKKKKKKRKASHHAFQHSSSRRSRPVDGKVETTITCYIRGHVEVEEDGQRVSIYRRVRDRMRRRGDDGEGESELKLVRGFDPAKRQQVRRNPRRSSEEKGENEDGGTPSSRQGRSRRVDTPPDGTEARSGRPRKSSREHGRERGQGRNLHGTNTGHDRVHERGRSAHRTNIANERERGRSRRLGRDDHVPTVSQQGSRRDSPRARAKLDSHHMDVDASITNVPSPALSQIAQVGARNSPAKAKSSPQSSRGKKTHRARIDSSITNAPSFIRSQEQMRPSNSTAHHSLQSGDAHRSHANGHTTGSTQSPIPSQTQQHRSSNTVPVQQNLPAHTSASSDPNPGPPLTPLPNHNASASTPPSLEHSYTPPLPHTQIPNPNLVSFPSLNASTTSLSVSQPHNVNLFSGPGALGSAYTQPPSPINASDSTLVQPSHFTTDFQAHQEALFSAHESSGAEAEAEGVGKKMKIGGGIPVGQRDTIKKAGQ